MNLKEEQVETIAEYLVKLYAEQNGVEIIIKEKATK